MFCLFADVGRESIPPIGKVGSWSGCKGDWDAFGDEEDGENRKRDNIRKMDLLDDKLWMVSPT